MDKQKTSAIRNIEGKMEALERGSLRHETLKHAKKFKTSWIDLGQALFSVWKDKLYREWGYEGFDSYAAKEIGIRKETAIKLVRSYSFMEQKEPAYIKKEYNEQAETSKVPTYESVDVLRQASNKDLDSEEYSNIRKYVLKDGKDAKDIKKDLKQMLQQKENADPEEIRAKKRMTALKRLVAVLRTMRKEMTTAKMLPDKALKEIEGLINTLEAELPPECAGKTT